MLHGSDVYDDPMAFKPERYNNDDAEMQKVNDLAFGFGRRACPGSHFAFGTLYSIVLTTLATCDILPGLDENGNEIIPVVKYTSGTIRSVIYLIFYVFWNLWRLITIFKLP